MLQLLEKDRLSFLGTGIAAILAKATGGVAVVLEHRYYGTCSYIVAIRITSSLREPSSRRIHRCAKPDYGLLEVRVPSFESVSLV